MAAPAIVINTRYQIQDVIPGGGMGIVYKAYDIVTKRHVALKTMRGALNEVEQELFFKEWTVLARLSHPNIVDILDKGEFDEGGQRKPYFVMPYLPGRTLDYLIANASQRLTVARVVEIMTQTCRGLQAAHEHGLVHRDLKPSNIFVMDDDTVKIIDFGVVHLTGTESATGIKGTLQYMSPEQIEMKPCSAASDIFSLSVACYEAFTGRKPFARTTEAETIEAIRSHIPPPVSELNPLVSQLLSRVVHKAMAKAPWHRFSTAREYAETLQKALRNEPIERFDPARLQPRIQRAKKAQSEGDIQFASEILTELEAEGNIDPEMTVLRIQIDQGVRQKSIHQLMDSARTRREEDELPLALQKIQEVLSIDPENSDALSLRSDIEKRRSESQIENWFRLVDQHVHNHSFGQAKQALEEIFKIDPNHRKAREVMNEVERGEEEINSLRTEKERLYQSALSCYQQGEISSALSKLERVLEMNRRSPDSAVPDRDAKYQGLYNQIRTEREAARTTYAEGRRYLADRNFARALELCAEFLKKTPGDPMFQALKLEAEELERQEQSAFIAEVARRTEAEPDLDRRVNILKEAAERYPNESHFQQSLRLTRDRRDLVNSIVIRARQYEDRSQFGEALGQWDILRNIYAQYPGIEFEIERVKRRRDEQAREEAKSRWVEQIDRNIAAGECSRARDLAHSALVEFPDDAELAGLERLACQSLERKEEAHAWLQRGQKLCLDREFAGGLEALRKAAALDNRNSAIRAALLGALVEQARSLLSQDWRASEPLIQEALTIDGSHPLAKSLQALVLDYKRVESLNKSISRAREMQAAGDLGAAIAIVENALVSMPHETRLRQLRSTLGKLVNELPTPGRTDQTVLFEQLAPVDPPPPKDSPDHITLDDTLLGTAFMPQPPFKPKEPSLRAAGVDPSPPALKDPATRGNSALRAAPPRRGNLPKAIRSSRFQWGAVLVLALVLLGVFLRPPRERSPLQVHLHSVAVEVNIPGATVRIDGRPTASFPIQLSPGEHKADAELLGYRPESQSFTVADGARTPYSIMFHLVPEPLHLQLSSDLKSGQVSFDGGQPIELQEGTFSTEIDALPAEHRMTLLRSGAESLSFSFRAEPGHIAILSSPMKSRDIDALVVSNLGAQARVYSTNASLKGGVKDNALQPIPADGLYLGNLARNAELTIVDGANGRTLPIEISKAPVLNILIASDPTTATLRVESNVPDAEVTINGHKERPMKAGAAGFPLAPGVYQVSVGKQGYNSEVRTVELKKGQVQPLPRFQLNPVAAQMASLAIESGTGGAEVWIDGRLSGSLGADGSYVHEGISPEMHVIVFKKADFEDKGVQKTFIAGQSVRISGAEAQLTPFGSLVLHISPANASVTYQGVNEARADQAENGTTVRLKAGRYLVAASATGRSPRQEPIDVEAGKSLIVEWPLALIEQPKISAAAPKPAPGSIEYFQDSASWTHEGGWSVHHGEGVSWLRGKEGTYVITILSPGSKKIAFFKKTRRVEWVVDVRDPANRIEYSLDSGGLERKAIADNKTISNRRAPIESDQFYRLRIEIRPEKIVISSNGKVLDDFPRPPGIPLGASGFKGEVALQIESGPEK